MMQFMYNQYFLVKCNINNFQKSLHKNKESNIYNESNVHYEVLTVIWYRVYIEHNRVTTKKHISNLQEHSTYVFYNTKLWSEM
jgi:hypothetical protein